VPSGTTGIGTSTNAFVGVGINAPVRQLQVTTGQTNGGLRITQTTTGFSALELFNTTTGGHNYALVSTGAGNSEGAGHFGIYDYSGGGYKLFINGSTGNLGVGTTTPVSKLDVNGNIRSTGKIFSSGDVANKWTTSNWLVGLETPTGVVWRSSSPGNSGLYMGQGMAANGWFWIFSGNTSNTGGHTQKLGSMHIRRIIFQV
jgi:hypothetical protein